MPNRPYLFSVVGTLTNMTFNLSKSLGSRLGYYFFQSERRLKLKEEDITYLRSHTLDLPGGMEHITYYKWGQSSKTLLMLHGWESGAIRWKPYIEKCLAKGYQVIALDAPGHGLSIHKTFNIAHYSNAVRPLITTYHPEITIGHSVGGFTALHSGNALPEQQPSKYILLAPNNNLLHVFDIYKEKLGLSDAVMERLIQDVKHIEGKPISYYVSETLLNQIKVPVDIIHDENDKVLPYSDSLKLSQLHSHVSLHTTVGHGHKLRSNAIVNKVLGLL